MVYILVNVQRPCSVHYDDRDVLMCVFQFKTIHSTVLFLSGYSPKGGPRRPFKQYPFEFRKKNRDKNSINNM